MASQAWTTTQGNEEYVAQGALGIAGQASTKRKFDLPGLITFQERAYALLDNILMNNLPRITVKDPEPKVLVRDEAPVVLDIKSDDTDTNFEGDTLRLSDTQATWLQAGDVLQVPQLFCDSDGANYTTTKYGSGFSQETVIVESVVISGAASGIANVFVKRGNGFSTAAAAAGTVTTILSEYKLVRQRNTIADGGNAPQAVDFEPFSVQNYCQFISKVWSETSVQGEMDVYGKETMEQKAARSRREFFREWEWALFYGRKAKHQTSGKNEYTTGGIVEFVAPAATALDGTTRFRDFGGAFDMPKFREETEIIYRYGNQMRRKDWFCGGQFYTVLWNNLEKFLTVNDSFSRRYGWTVHELDAGHGLAMLHRHPLFTDQHTTTVNYAKDAIVVDTEFVNMMVMAGHNVQVRQNIQAPRSHTIENELFAMLGLYRRFAEAHAVVYGITG